MIFRLITIIIIFLIGCSENKSQESVLLSDAEWDLISYGYSEGNKSTLLPGTTYSLNFNDDSNTVRGGIDCNSFDSSYTADASEIKITLISVTKIACSRIAETKYQEQNSFILNALSSLTTYSISDSMLVLTSADSSQLMYVSK